MKIKIKSADMLSQRRIITTGHYQYHRFDPLTLNEAVLVATLRFQDFCPKLLKAGDFRSNDVYQDFDVLLDRANQWLMSAGVDVINIETVVLREKDSTKACFVAAEPYCYQFIRVWYSAENAEFELEDNVA